MRHYDLRKYKFNNLSSGGQICRLWPVFDHPSQYVIVIRWYLINGHCLILLFVVLCLNSCLRNSMKQVTFATHCIYLIIDVLKAIEIIKYSEQLLSYSSVKLSYHRKLPLEQIWSLSYSLASFLILLQQFFFFFPKPFITENYPYIKSQWWKIIYC